ncbi:MAG: hypothetical protein ACI89U_001394 [Gammaproteobacteria bacterium]|jgi:hypothetical protein
MLYSGVDGMKNLQVFTRQAAIASNSVVFVFLLSVSNQTSAQSVPSDLLDLSIEELFAADVGDDRGSSREKFDRWNFSYSYKRSHFSDYLDGTKRVARNDVLFSPGQEPRTDKNFPVVPTEIDQEVHALIVGYEFEKGLMLSISVPYIKQSTDHISVVPGYSAFNISSDGFGDVSVIGSYRFASSNTKSWQIGMGLSIPTGSIEQEGDTPRASGKQQLPYTMQLGSGTYDVPAYLSYVTRKGLYMAGFDLTSKLRLGENDRDYRLGNSASASTWIRFTNNRWVQPSLKLSYRYSSDIYGEDKSLGVGGPFPYPAPVVEPSQFGGKQINLLLGLRIPVFGSGRYIDLEAGKSLYQSLNGPQSREDYQFSVTVNSGF